MIYRYASTVPESIGLDPEGDWVTYEDHVAEVARLRSYLLADDENAYAQGFRDVSSADSARP